LLEECYNNSNSNFSKIVILIHFPALNESEPLPKNWIITSKISLISSFMPTEHPIITPFSSKDTNHIENIESFQYKELANCNNRVNATTLLKTIAYIEWFSSQFQPNNEWSVCIKCIWTNFNHSFIIKFQELVRKLFFVSPEQLVKKGSANSKLRGPPQWSKFDWKRPNTNFVRIGWNSTHGCLPDARCHARWKRFG
jgi:hypothetical protein